ncbi:MAG TPA: SGNH/GDSL hydrolase family protein [Oligoflexus sp.]|uniref:SGNH/GDSL hydrolase family protein n=1 Tax=Oligoflexus sp. TaxID=1971216 RepID=UPI002D2F6DC2|nr:SGNH/GDSL hydrolase family protein [Oligoflexus sp.]HYX32907.1 SGNH/GDSL hydrolase family protein [Oligoflexus sp.]
MRLFLEASVVAALSLVSVSAHAESAEDVNRAANETIIIGDSIFALNGVINSELEEISSLDIDSYARNGAIMSGIVRQYQQARANGIARTVIMNGGGNDVLANMGNCRAFNQTCINVIEKATSQGLDLVNQMEADGVERIFFLGYYYTTSLASGLEKAVDYAMSRAATLCENTTVRCEVVDTRDIMQGSGNLSWDGIHPSRTGSIKMAQLLWERMQTID